MDTQLNPILFGDVLIMARWVIVGFKYYKDHSVFYGKADTDETLLDMIQQAINRGADLISIRKVGDNEK